MYKLKCIFLVLVLILGLQNLQWYDISGVQILTFFNNGRCVYNPHKISPTSNFFFIFSWDSILWPLTSSKPNNCKKCYGCLTPLISLHNPRHTQKLGIYKQPWDELGKKYDSNFIFTFAVKKIIQRHYNSKNF